MIEKLRSYMRLFVAATLLSACSAGSGKPTVQSTISQSSPSYSYYGLSEVEIAQFDRLSHHWDAGREAYVFFVSDFQEAIDKSNEGVQVDGKELVFDSLFVYQDKEPINNGYYVVFVEKES